MLKIKEAIIVEGKYDKIKLSNIVDTLIIETNGFGIYKDKLRLNFIKKIAKERGIIILTDSDASGFQIRHYIESAVPKSQIKNIYAPDIFGKEKRKTKYSKEGKLGVEGIDSKILLERLNSLGVECKDEKRRLITTATLFEDGLSGCDGSKEKRKKILKLLDLPEFLSSNSFLDVLNSMLTFEEYKEMIEKIYA